MLRIHQSANVEAARHYFDSELGRSDYYGATEESGTWFGKGAERLGLQGAVKREQFHALIENRHPTTGQKINKRNNSYRRPGYDFVFNAPKSVSLLANVTQDERVNGVFRQAVLETLGFIEQEMHVRVRKGGVVDTRRTGNIVASIITHQLARPVDGISCPSTHIHAYLHNTSLDSLEGKNKAGEFFPIIRDAVYYEGIFHSRLAQGLVGLGYQIENKPFSFEVAGIGDENISRFSRRGQEIENLAHQLGVTGNSKAVSKLAALTRQKKTAELSAEEQEAEWRDRFDWGSLELKSGQRPQPKVSAREAVDRALESIFERRSVFSARRIVAEALGNSLGDCSFEEIACEFRKTPGLIVKLVDGVSQVTTKQVLREEKAVLHYLKKTKSTQTPLLGWYRERAQCLNQEQREAIEAIMRSRDRVICLSGKAGSGKTTLMKTATAAIHSVGIDTAVFAPTSSAAHSVLKSEGFENSETVQRLIADPELQEKMKGKLLWIDEAGLLSLKDTIAILRIAHKQGARLVFSGDAYQNKSISRGDAFRLICSSPDVEVKETRQIFRQRNNDYRKAVTALSLGDAEQAIDLLDEMGAITEVADFEERMTRQAQEFVDSLDRYRSVLAVSPTHLEGRLLTLEIRTWMREGEKLGSAELAVPAYSPRNFTEGQQKLAFNFRKGDVVRFHRKSGEFAKGDRARVIEKNDQGVFVQKLGEVELRLLGADAAENFNVFEESVISLAVGDRVRMTRNARSLSGKRLFNGDIHQVTGIRDGVIELNGRHQIHASEGLLQWGYVTTPHSSQGKTADKVIVSQSGLSFDAASLENFYVAVSRGRDAVSIYTDSKEGLLDSVRDSNYRMLATELEAEMVIDEEEIQATIEEDNVEFADEPSK